MSSDPSTAFSLLAIGMITVFVVLLLVVVTGNVLIRVVNSLANDKIKLAPSKVAAISAAVEAFTNGRGRITRIEKD